MKTFDLDECAQFLKISSPAVFEMASRGELPGARIGRSWVFLEEDLVEYVRIQVRCQRRERQAGLPGQTRVEEPGLEDQDKLLCLPTVLQHRRGRHDIAPDRASGDRRFGVA